MDAAVLGVAAEGRSLEDVATPLSAIGQPAGPPYPDDVVGRTATTDTRMR